jgi:hypothetical protein
MVECLSIEAVLVICVDVTGLPRPQPARRPDSTAHAENGKRISISVNPDSFEALVSLCYFFFACPSAEQGLSVEQRSPITPTAWISISMPGRAKLVTVMSALPG